jgi:fibronectin type 3 domain-containing protein
MQVVEPRGGRSPMRAPVLVELAAPPSPPGPLQAETAEGEVRLRWEGPGPDAVAYNVYRRPAESPIEPDAPLNATPLGAAEYTDRTFTYDTRYVYYVRAVARNTTTPCESVAGPTVEVLPHDRFAPTVPSGIAVAVEAGQIRLYWFPNAEPDLAGYRIYRRSDEAAEAERIAEVGATESSYVDASAIPGVRYHYAVSAVDGATPPNESPRSEEGAERLAPLDRPANTEDGGDGAQR